MKILRGAAAAVLLAGALAPEFARYRAERMLRVAASAFSIVLTHPSEVADPAAALDRIAAIGMAAAPGLPGDSRPLILAGGARLASGQLDAAIENYREALRLGERAETDLNLGRAYEGRGDTARSHAAFLRAVWISPALLSAVLPDIAGPLREELARLEAELRAGRLKAPPPLQE
jgi:tetratricopeptide (TPR) repeat protein